MSIIERGKAFVQHLRELANRSAWDWRRCPRCGSTDTSRNGSRKVHPWMFEGRQEIRIQRHWCYGCRHSYSESSPFLVRGSWYAGGCTASPWTIGSTWAVRYGGRGR